MALQKGDEFYWSTDNDILEVRIMTSDYNTYFKESAPIRDKSKIKKLLRHLEEKGIVFGRQWFE